MNFEIDSFDELKNALHHISVAFEGVPEEVLFNCKLIADELLSNALKYGGGRAQLVVEHSGDEMRISVRSARDYRPPEKSVCSDVTSERGRGLYLVDALSERREYSEEAGISVVVLIRK